MPREGEAVRSLEIHIPLRRLFPARAIFGPNRDRTAFIRPPRGVTASPARICRQYASEGARVSRCSRLRTDEMTGRMTHDESFDYAQGRPFDQAQGRQAGDPCPSRRPRHGGMAQPGGGAEAEGAREGCDGHARDLGHDLRGLRECSAVRTARRERRQARQSEPGHPRSARHLRPQAGQDCQSARSGEEGAGARRPGLQRNGQKAQKMKARARDRISERAQRSSLGSESSQLSTTWSD
jgi:hypothetical protein